MLNISLYIYIIIYNMYKSKLIIKLSMYCKLFMQIKAQQFHGKLNLI